MTSTVRTDEAKSRRIEWRQGRTAPVWWLIDLDTGKTLARIMGGGDGSFSAFAYELTARTIHPALDGAMHWCIENT